MKYRILFVAGFILSVMGSCTRSKSLVDYPVKMRSSFDELSDSTLFSDVRDMTYSSGKLYFTDYKNSQLYVTDEEGTVIRKYSQNGAGPEDMNGAFYLFVNNTGVYVYDDGNSRFLQVPDTGSMQIISKAGHNHSMYGFIVNNGMLIYADYADEGIIACDNMEGKVIERFGKPVKFDNPVKTRMRNGRFLNTDGVRLFATSDCMPLVECYDLSTKQLLDQIDLNEIPDFEDLMVKHSSEESDDNSYFRIIEDTYSVNGKLYILYNDPHAQKYTVNKVLVLNTEKELTPLGIYTLPAQIYTSFCVTEDGKRIFAMNYQNSRIEQFQIEK